MNGYCGLGSCSDGKFPSSCGASSECDAAHTCDPQNSICKLNEGEVCENADQCLFEFCATDENSRKKCTNGGAGEICKYHDDCKQGHVCESNQCTLLVQQDCKYNEWSAWTECSSCDAYGNGSRTRTRTMEDALNGGLVCDLTRTFFNRLDCVAQIGTGVYDCVEHSACIDFNCICDSEPYVTMKDGNGESHPVVFLDEGPTLGHTFHISLEECEARCKAQYECSSFAYSKKWDACFLKSKCANFYDTELPVIYDGAWESHVLKCRSKFPAECASQSFATGISFVSSVFILLFIL
jgi:hypothetical protein